jgi:alginate O-acetyltransferase complex protein AlgI
MLFNSFAFLILTTVTFFLYYIPKLSKFQVQILIISSLIFYAYEAPALLLLLLISTGLNVVISYNVAFTNIKNKKAVAIIGVIINLIILAFFKYSPLFANTFNISGDLGQFLLTIPLPIGISFFTFEGISLVIDLYKKRFYNEEEFKNITFTRHAQRTLFFISFFPHLVAGPILKAHDFLPQIKIKTLKEINWQESFKALVVGYFLKMVVADNLKDFTFWIAYPYFKSFSSITLITMLFGYSCQIFADFAGYSLIAIGLGKLFGYDLQQNFNFPYISTTFKEFWKRWHISLSSFLMEYLYIPLGGNRKGKVRTYINLIITMFLGGLWHGAAWSYAIWGTFHGIALAIERFITNNLIIKSSKFLNLFCGGMVFFFVTWAWLLFKLPNFEHVIDFHKCVLENFYAFDDTQKITYILLYSLPVILYHIIYLIKNVPIFRFKESWEYTFYGFLIFLIIVNSGSSGMFIYFQF